MLETYNITRFFNGERPKCLLQFSVYTIEDISSLPILDAKFQEVKSDYLRQLIATPEMVAKKIKAMNDNKSPGVDGILPKLPMETVEQVSIPQTFQSSVALQLQRVIKFLG